MSLITIDMTDSEELEYLAAKYDATVEEIKEVNLLIGVRGAWGNYEEEIKQLDRGPYSNEPDDWLDAKIKEILTEIRAM